MNMRKIGVVGSFAAGAAFALAPLAAADNGSTSFDFNSVLQSEVQSMNFLFQSQAAMAGIDADLIDKATPTLADPLAFDTIDKGDVNAAFASLLYGFNPADNAASDPGSYVLFNGAATEFTNAFNVELYSLLNSSSLIDADYLFGSQTVIDAALATDSVSGAFTTFFDAGVQDVMGYFDMGSIDL